MTYSDLVFGIFYMHFVLRSVISLLLHTTSSQDTSEALLLYSPCVYFSIQVPRLFVMVICLIFYWSSCALADFEASIIVIRLILISLFHMDCFPLFDFEALGTAVYTMVLFYLLIKIVRQKVYAFFEDLISVMLVLLRGLCIISFSLYTLDSYFSFLYEVSSFA